jgi:hypothetical protein
VKKYENLELGIAFEYPSDWISVSHCKAVYGIDVLIHKDLTNFGIMRVSEKIRTDVISCAKTLEEILKTSIQQNEVIVGSVQLNKHLIGNAESATIILHKSYKIGIIIQERTIVVHNNNEDQIFIVAFEDLPENYEFGYSQTQLKSILESFRFL